MFNDIKLYKPDFAIDCSQVKQSAELYEIMRQHGIKRCYVYGMCHKITPLVYDFLKVGKSTPDLGEKRERSVGERIVRQMAWLPGWDEIPVKSTTGDDFWKGINNRLMPRGILTKTFNKNEVTIAVWDITRRINQSSKYLDVTDKEAAGWAEGELEAQYRNKFMRAPYLNIRNPSKSKEYKRTLIEKDIFNQLFVGSGYQG